MPEKILLYGGSFDPPHLGHLKMLEASVKRLNPNRVFVIPSFHSPLKVSPRTPLSDRIRMLEILVRSSRVLKRAGVRVSRFEEQKGRKTFTFEALRHFRDKFPGADLFFLIGSDSAESLAQWKRQKDLKNFCAWVVGVRPSSPALPGNRGYRITRLAGMMPAISSTAIRSRILSDESVLSLIPPEVEAYIRNEKLYGLNIHRDLEKTLNGRRFEHTLEVARLARRLAERHGLDPEKASLAGLLHDAGRRFNLGGMARYAAQKRLAIRFRERMMRSAPILLHAFISEDLARKKYRIDDREVLGAIRNHTLGEVRMPALDRLLYVADVAAGDRAFPEAEKIRGRAAKNLNAAFLQAVETKKRYVLREGRWLHPDTGRLLAWARRLP